MSMKEIKATLQARKDHPDVFERMDAQRLITESAPEWLGYLVEQLERYEKALKDIYELEKIGKSFISETGAIAEKALEDHQ